MQSLPGVQALLFDVFGTVVDWHASIVDELSAASRGTVFHNEDWASFASEWRAGYIRTTLHVAQGGNGPATVDEMHRALLDEILESPRWNKLAPIWDSHARHDLCLAWHRLHGWSDTTPGLYALKSKYIIGTLSNGNVRLLIDMAKHADLPWDVVFSSELFGSYKPNPKIYQGAARCLALPPHQVALVAAHFSDCAAAKACGLKAVYIRRPTEDRGTVIDEAKVDVIVDDFHELARLLDVVGSHPKL